MRISEFKNFMIAADGGTIICEALMSNGAIEYFGLDARIPKTKSERELFKGLYPEHEDAEIYKRDSKEEKVIIAAIHSYLSDRCGFLRREALSEANLGDLKNEDLSDGIAVHFLSAINDR